MSPIWFVLAFSTTIISALVTLLDSHFMSRRMPGTRAYMLICGAFLLPVSIVTLILFPVPAGTGLAPIGAITGSAVITSFASLLMINAMKSQDVARVAPVVSTAPVFVAILATIFLGESLGLQQWLGIVAVISGAVIISFRWDSRGTSHFHSRPFFVLLGVAIIAATGSVFNKFGLEYMSYWTCAGIDFLVASLVILGLCLRRDVIASLKAMANSRQAINLTLVNQAIATAATIMAFWTIQLGPVALASTVFNSKPLLVFAASAVIGRCAPGFMICEKLSARGWVIKGAGTAAVVGGLAAVFI
ncbi:EamA-like transporter family protein [Dehalogenimonas formicexedens]|uniref:EamA-like transporter family protein n=1 Tax=Dehalogenimonas formicexedens TaxID=1839801 RepID=A0A1P8F977_9CHLR|nr:EamA family transporter [Dehalogenimonas formicexedens]APV45021.1 EamA-like transporter family protein [Dehalogenimonas formicexedens]